MTARHSRVLQRIADTDERVQEYEFAGSYEDAPHWLHLAEGWQVDGCHSVNGGTVKECLSELSMVQPCTTPGCCDDRPAVEPGLSIHEWAGIDAAGPAEHDECFQKYHGEEWSQHHFAITDDGDRVTGVRVVTPSSDTANGTWTLAEILASEGCQTSVDTVANMMRAAVQEHTSESN